MTLYSTNQLSFPPLLFYRRQKSHRILPVREGFKLGTVRKEYKLRIDQQVNKLAGDNNADENR